MRFYIKAAAVLLCAAIALSLCCCTNEAETLKPDTDTVTDVGTADVTSSEDVTGAEKNTDAGDTAEAGTDTGKDTVTEAEITGSEEQLHTVHEYESEMIEPTCEETGVIKYTCACGAAYEETVDALGHDFVFYRVIDATFLFNGYTEYKCSRCGATEKRDPTEYTGSGIELPIIELD
jgi:hypothetical protein